MISMVILLIEIILFRIFHEISKNWRILFIGFFIYLFLFPFLVMVYVALYENAISDNAEDREDAVFARSEDV